MSRLSNQAHAWPPTSRLNIHVSQFIGAIGHYVTNEKNVQKLYNNTAEPQTGYQKHLHKEETRFPNGTFRESSGNSQSPIPLPDWSVALGTWGISWKLHVYGFSALFIMLTVVSAAIFLRFRPRVQKFKIVYNTLILLATSGVFRAVFMLVDPYGYQGRMASLMVGVMMQAVYPLLCACYGLTQVMLLRLTNVDVGRSRLRTLSCLLGCTLTYLFMVVVIETLVSYQRSLKLLLLVDSGCFIVWSTSLGGTFICSGFRLTQYAMETKKAHKQLNTFSNQRRSASNTTGLSTTTNTASDADPSLFNVDMLSTVSDALMLPNTVPATSDSVFAEAATSCSMQNCVASESFLPAAAHRPITQVRLSRPRLKISDQDRMTITIATDDDDVSTSSTDVDHPPREKGTRRVRRVRKYAKQKRGNKRGPVRSRSQNSSSIYRAVSVGDDDFSRKSSFSCPQGENQSSCTDDKTTLDNRTSILNYGNPQGPSINSRESITSFSCEKQDFVPNETSTFSELSLTGSPSLSSQHVKYGPKYEIKDHSSYDEGSNTRTETCKQMLLPVHPLGLSSGDIANDSFPPESTTFDVQINNLHSDSPTCNPIQKPLFNNNNSCDKTTEPFVVCIPVDHHEQNSWRENGYLADTENIFSCSTFSRLSRSFRRKRKSHDQFTPTVCDVSSPRSSSSHSDDSSTASPVLQSRFKPATSASLGLFRIRQSTVVQRAVHLTYFLTFLFMFASLLQLYTVFGVYGVLGSNPRPDPWPWLILHTIFRATEVSIGFSIAAIACITLNYRHQRAKRRHQQQQHLVATRDCIV